MTMVLAHLLLAWSWIATQSRRLFTAQSFRARINYLINMTLFAGVTAVIFSGILISQKAIPTLTGTNAAPEMDWRWDLLHNRFSQNVLILSGFHLAINWDWALAAIQKLFFPIVEKARKTVAASEEARYEIGPRIVTDRSDLSGCRCICRIDGNLWRLEAACFSKCKLAGGARAPTFRTSGPLLSRRHW
jgi:hypothetical protein